MSELWQWISETINIFHGGDLPEMGLVSYTVLALLVATEGPLSTLLGAAAAAAGMAELRWVLLATILGNVVGDCAWYSVGYLGKADTLRRYGRHVGIKANHVDRLELGMQSHAVKLILLSKVAYGLIIPTLVTAGVARVPLRKWFPLVFVIETVWSVVLVYVGYHATWLLVEFERGLRVVGVVVVALVLGGIILFVYRKRRASQPVLSDEIPARLGSPSPVVSRARPSLMPRIKTSVIHSIAPSPLMGEAITVRFAEATQVWDSVAFVPGPRLEAEPVEGSG